MRAVELFMALGMIVTLAKTLWSDEPAPKTARVCVLEPSIEAPVAPDATLDFHPFCQ